MDSGPPLNLSTSVKVEAHNHDHLSIKSEIYKHSDGNQSYVLLQPLTNNENGVIITGEEVRDTLDENETDSQENEISDDNVDNNCKSYICSRCPERFLRANQLRNHEKSHIEEKVHACEQCLETFSRLSLLLRHKQQHVERAYECPECGIPLNSYSTFRVHMKKHKGEKRFKCSDCTMSFVQQSHLNTHRRKHTGEKPYSCPHCETKFKQVSHLTTHLRTHTKDKPYVCEYCNASFSQTGSLKRHRRSHTGEKPYQCKNCSAVFVEKRNLQRHLLSHSGIRPFKCDLCSASFTQLIDLKRHIVSHSGLKPHKCDVCEASFSRKNNLKWHKLTHEGNTPYKCDVCNVGFRVGRDLKYHKRSHVDVKPYSCVHCKASFLQLSTLRRHLNVHSGNKPFSCDQCQATFFEKFSLKRHIQRHDAVRQFSCNHCMSMFFNLSTLRRHKFVVHNEGKYEDDDSKPLNISTKRRNSVAVSAGGEEENSLHIYEPSYPKPNHVPESNNLVTQESVQVLPREPAITELSANECQVVISDTATENGPTLLITQEGQPPRTGKPAGNCQNHNAHLHTLIDGSANHWQAWCFCETTNIPNSDTLPMSAQENLQPINSQTENVNLNYNNQARSLFSSLEVIHAPVNHLQNEQEQPVTIENRVQNENKSQPVSQNLYHSNSVSHSSEFHTSNSSYPQFSNQISQFNEDETDVHKEHQILQSTNASLHHSQSVISNSRNSSADKNCYMVTESSQIVSNHNTVINNFKKNVPERENKNCNIVNSNKNHMPQTYKNDEDKNENTDYQEVESVAIVTSEGNEQFRKSDDKEEPHDYRNTQIIPPESVPENYLEDHSSKLQTFNYDDKLPKENVIKHPTSLNKDDKEVYHIEVPLNSATLPTVLNNPPNQKTADIDSYHLPVPVYSHLPQNLSHDLAKEPVTLQYSVTVNNPATGDIQIQSELFPAKPDDDLASKQPIKKRKVIKSLMKKLVCNFCAKQFQNKTQLLMHQRKHTGEKPFTCPICKQTFAHNNSLSIHMRNHTGEKPYPCHYCGSSFAQKSNLGVHLRVHTGERPFKCDICDTKFSQGSHLIAHKRIHNNDRPYVCATCGQAFTQKSALKRHEVKHSGLKPHKCITCKAKFNLKEELNQHIVIHNSGKKAADKTTGRRTGKKLVKKKVTEKDILEVNENENSAEKNDSKEVIQDGSIHVELKEENENKTTTKDIKRTNELKISKTKTKEMPEPVRVSKRLKEAAEKKKFKTENSDYITGDLEEIDRMEELEDQIALSRAELYKKEKSESKEVQSWCFCEVSHGPNEPHTHIGDGRFAQTYSSQERHNSQLTSNVLVSSDNGREGLLQLSIPQISHTVVLQGDQVALHNPHQNHNANNVTHLSVNSDNIVIGPSVVSESRVLNSNNSEAATLNSQFLGTSEQIIPSQDVHSNDIGHGDTKTVYSTAQIISGQVLNSGQFVTPEGTFFIEAGDIINSGAVVLNSSPGTIFFDITTEGQLLNVPISANVSHEPVIVAGTSSLESNVDSTATEAVYTTSADPNSATTIAFSVRDSHSNPYLGNVSQSEMSNPNILHSVQSSIGNSSGDVSSSTSHTTSVHYTQINSSDIGLFNTSISFEQPPSAPVEDSESGTTVVREEKVQQIIVNVSKCSVCGKEYASKNTLKQHMKSNHPGLHFCNICMDAFTTKDHLNTHKLQHKSASCPECNLVFGNTNSLNQHRQKQHNISGLSSLKKSSKNFSCDKCKASFSMVSDLNRHILSHTGAKPFKCKQCGACFTRKSSLNKHERIHTGEKPYTCKDCGLSFTYKYQINRHRAQHEDEQTNYSMPYVFS